MIIAYDFNKNLQMYNLKEIYKKNLRKNHRGIKFIDIDKTHSDKQLQKIDIYWGNRLNIEILNKMKNLKWVHLGSSGVNNELKKIILQKKIKLTNSSNVLIKPMVASLIAYIFSLARGLHFAIILKNKRKFDRKNFEKYIKNILDVYDSNILIVGYGSIGKELAKALKHFTPNIFGIKKNVKTKDNYIKKIHNLFEMPKIINKMDIIVNLLPDNKETKQAFNKKIFKKMKKNCIFINLGRGETVNEKELQYFISQKKIGSVGLDVFDRETNYINVYQPLKKTSKFLNFENIIITPHVANITNTYWKKQIELFSNNIEKFKKNKKMQNILY